MKPRIWDTFIFGTEADLPMLECHLYEMAEVTHKFVIAEATRNHQGQPKPLWYWDNRERFAAWQDQIIHVIADTDDIPPPPDRVTYWDLETRQRDAIAFGITDIDPDDILIHGDVDEIPRPGMVAPNITMAARHHVYALEWECPSEWASTVCVRAGQAPKSFRAVRNLMRQLPVVDDAAWHLSWLGGPAECMKKFDSTVHIDIPLYVHEDVANGRVVRDGWHWQGAWTKMLNYRGDDWPAYIKAGNEPAIWHKDGWLAELGSLHAAAGR